MFAIPEFHCLPGTWPTSFTGSVAVGVTEFREAEPRTLWLLFQITDGVNSAVLGLFGEGVELPADIMGLAPVIVTSASAATWELADGDHQRFYTAIETGLVHISGDFRMFGRYTPSLLRLTHAAELWRNLNAVGRRVAEAQGLAI